MIGSSGYSATLEFGLEPLCSNLLLIFILNVLTIHYKAFEGENFSQLQGKTSINWKNVAVGLVM